MKNQHHHGPNCGHTAVRHEHHTDYLAHGQLEHEENGRIKHHRVAVTAKNPDSCRPIEAATNHTHGPNCGHEMVPHGDHMDYLVNDHLEHVHGDHVDDHGPLDVVSH